jgi:hypothetical protein
MGLMVMVAVAFAQQPLVVQGNGKQEVKLTAQSDSARALLAYEKQKNLTLQYQMLQEQFQKQTAEMQKQFSDYEKDITAWIAATKKAEGFGDDVTYDRDQDKWYRSEQPKAAAQVHPATKSPAK